MGGLLVGLLITYATTGTILDPRSWVVIRTLLAHPPILVLGLLAWEQGNVDVAAQDDEEALSILREGDDTLWRGYAQLLLRNTRMSQGRIVEARPLLEESLSIFKVRKIPRGEALTLFYLGTPCPLDIRLLFKYFIE